MTKIVLVVALAALASAAAAPLQTSPDRDRVLSEVASPSAPPAPSTPLVTTVLTTVAQLYLVAQVVQWFNDLSPFVKGVVLYIVYAVYGFFNPEPVLPPSIPPSPPMAPSPSTPPPPLPPAIPGYEYTGTETADIKTEAYYTLPVGASVKIVVQEIGGAELGVATYPVLAQYQASTLKQLLYPGYPGTLESTFTEAKDSTRSSGNIRDSMYVLVHGGGGINNRNQYGDMFIDFDEPLVANAQSGFWSYTTNIRLTSGARTVTNSNGHWLGGIGGYHYHNAWSSHYESMPMHPYCAGYNYYGNYATSASDYTVNFNGNVAGCMGGGTDTNKQVLISMYTADSTMLAFVLHSNDGVMRRYEDTAFWGDETEVGV